MIGLLFNQQELVQSANEKYNLIDQAVLKYFFYLIVFSSIRFTLQDQDLKCSK